MSMFDRLREAATLFTDEQNRSILQQSLALRKNDIDLDSHRIVTGIREFQGFPDATYRGMKVIYGPGLLAALKLPDPAVIPPVYPVEVMKTLIDAGWDEHFYFRSVEEWQLRTERAVEAFKHGMRERGLVHEIPEDEIVVDLRPTGEKGYARVQVHWYPEEAPLWYSKYGGAPDAPLGGTTMHTATVLEKSFQVDVWGWGWEINAWVADPPRPPVSLSQLLRGNPGFEPKPLSQPHLHPELRNGQIIQTWPDSSQPGQDKVRLWLAPKTEPGFLYEMGSYRPQAVTFTSAAGGGITNDEPIEFAGLTGTIEGIAITDSQGNLVASADIAPKELKNGDTFEISPGSFSITLE